MTLWLHRLANAGMLAGILLFTGLAVHKTWRSPDAPSSRPVSGRAAGIAPAVFNQSERTLLLILREDCRYCTDSMPFYRRLVEERARVEGKAARVVAVVLTQYGAGDAVAYIRRQNLAVDEAVALAPEEQASMPIAGTPTIVLVDRQGEIKQQWVGRLGRDGEDSVLASIVSRAATATASVRP